MVVCRDYWFSHAAMDSYRLCEKCPQPPSNMAMYKIQCSKHNSQFVTREDLFYPQYRSLQCYPGPCSSFLMCWASFEYVILVCFTAINIQSENSLFLENLVRSHRYLILIVQSLQTMWNVICEVLTFINTSLICMSKPFPISPSRFIKTYHFEGGGPYVKISAPQGGVKKNMFFLSIFCG